MYDKEFDRFAEFLEKEHKDGWGGYFSGCVRSAQKAYKAMESDNHSGASWHFASNVLCQALWGDRLAPIEKSELKKPSEYPARYKTDKYVGWKFETFKDLPLSFYRITKPDGTTFFDDDRRVRFVVVKSETDLTNVTKEDKPPCLQRLLNDIADEMFPISFPYHFNNIFKLVFNVAIKDFGDMSSDNWYIHVISVVDPDIIVHPVNRYFHFYTHNTEDYSHVLKEIDRGTYDHGKGER
jgi:hypothetical protein